MNAPVRAAETSDHARQQLNQAVGAILQADGAKASALIHGIASEPLEPKTRQFAECALSRLDKAPITERGAGIAGDALLAYRIYWQQSLVMPVGRTQAEAVLLKSLGTLLGQPNLKDMDAAEVALASKLTAAGLHSQQGTTGLLRDLMIWRSQTEKSETVPLPEGANTTLVVYLDDFLSRGWSSYFTCDRTGTGGWTAADGLFVIVPSYQSLTDENFRVNFLAHESQHFSDGRRFPNLKPWELEYRAKLVELAYAEETSARILTNFTNNQGANPDDPHSYANQRVLVVLRKQLGLPVEADLAAVPVSQLQPAAVAALKADSASRQTVPN